MNNRDSRKYWKIEEVEDTEIGKLHFKPYYDDEIILSYQQDKKDKNTFWYVSKDLRVEIDCIIEDSPIEARERFEEMYLQHIEDNIDYYETLREKFVEEDLL